MEIIKAQHLGFCFGVRDALAMARAVEAPQDVTVHGELVHNPIVLHELDVRGFQSSSEENRAVPKTKKVLVTAHGISNKERGRLHAAGKKLIDTTCPLVARVHTAATSFASQGRLVIVIGRPGHVEVRGIVEDLPQYVVVPDQESVTEYSSKRIGIVSQSTTPPDQFELIRTEIEQQNPHADIQSANTVCQPTIDRQLAVDELAANVDAVVVVGGKNSNNTGQLVRRVTSVGKPAFHIESAAELQAQWFAEFKTVGLTAGTSTPDSVIDAVYSRLSNIQEPVE